ncbi:MAG: Hsp20/alpha crystallin family protein [Spirochaetota bacterium]|nr:Hsp20/alpha crystallin family protein [Spirochaetota bacterium]
MKYMVRYNPNRSYLNLWNDFDALLGNLFDSDNAGHNRSIVVDIRETGDSYLIEAELPGFSEKDIDVKVENRVLSISASIEQKHEQKDEKKDEQFLVRERRSETFSRSFSLPEDVDVDRIDGNYRNGVLTLSLAKKPETKPRNIKVKAA